MISFSSTRRILLVDDDPALCEAIVFALETEDYSVRAYDSGEAVLGVEPQPSGDWRGYRPPIARHGRA